MQFCPRCGSRRVAGLRFCGDCRFDFQRIDEDAANALVPAESDASQHADDIRPAVEPPSGPQSVDQDTTASQEPAAVAADLAQANVLARLGIPTQLEDGVDIVVGRHEGAQAGVTLWVQNPYDSDASVTAAIGPAVGGSGGADILRLHIAALEIGRLVIPLRQTEELVLAVTSRVAFGKQDRVRSLEPSEVVWGRTAGSVALGIAAAMALGVGRYSVYRRGGIAKQPASFNIPWSGSDWLPAEPVRYERLYAQTGSRESYLEFQKSARNESAVRGPGILLIWAATGIAGLVGFMASGFLLTALASAPPYRDIPAWVFLVAAVVGLTMGGFGNQLTTAAVMSRGWASVLQQTSVLNVVDGVPWTSESPEI